MKAILFLVAWAKVLSNVIFSIINDLATIFKQIIQKLLYYWFLHILKTNNSEESRKYVMFYAHKSFTDVMNSTLSTGQSVDLLEKLCKVNFDKIFKDGPS